MIHLKASPRSYWEPRKQRVIVSPLVLLIATELIFFFYHYHKQSLDVDICSVLLHDVRKKKKIKLLVRDILTPRAQTWIRALLTLKSGSYDECKHVRPTKTILEDISVPD